MDTGESPKNNDESQTNNPTEGNDSKSAISEKTNRETTNTSLSENQGNDTDEESQQVEPHEQVEPNSNINEETTNPSLSENQGIDKDNEESIQLEYEDVNSLEDKQEEDVPEDFFDDFLKEDFMAGLDIVDEDDEDQEDRKAGDLQSKASRKKPTKRPEIKSKNRLKKTAGKIDHVKKFRESPPGQKISEKELKHQEFEEKMQKLDEELEEMKKAKPKKKEKPKSGVDADNFDIRRDPEKTRQAIQKDKIRSAKDKEKRIITDIVETGLVPPGMELEIGIEEVRRIEKNLPPGDLRAKLKPRKSRSKSPEKVKSSVKKAKTQMKKKSPKRKRKSRTPTKNSVSSTLSVPDPKVKSPHKSSDRSVSRRSPRRSPIQRRSPHARSPRRSPNSRRSPLRRSPLMRRSPLRRSPLYRPVPVCSPPFRIVERSPIMHRRRSRSISPGIRRRSPMFRRSRSRDRSPGYRRKRDRSFSPMERSRRRRSRSPVNKLRKEEKISFLEELAAKLNETHPHPMQQQLPPPVQMTYMMPMQAQPVVAPVPPPVPVPPPQSIFFSAAPAPQPMQQQFDHYDQSFFIGNPAQQVQQQEQHQQPPVSQAIQPNGYVIEVPDSPPNTRDVDKLFGDKRIKLSDFLAITAKPQVNNSSPAKLQEKIQVIQRCQHAIKILDEKRFMGPLVVHKTNLYQSSTEMTMSPLLRRPVIQLPFTTPGKKQSNASDFNKCCDTLLYRLGLDNTPSVNKDLDKPVSKTVSFKEVPRKESPPPIFSGLQGYSESPTPPKVITRNLSTQTDRELSACRECLRRKGILYKTSGVQAGGPALSFSVSTQVSEGDFYSMIPKTQSLASLTPAQLLGKQSMLSEQSRTGRNSDNMSRYIPSPPPPPIFQFLPSQGSSSQQAPSPMFHQTIIPSLLKMPMKPAYGERDMPMKPTYGERDMPMKPTYGERDMPMRDKTKPAFSEKRRGGFNKKRY